MLIARIGKLLFSLSIVAGASVAPPEKPTARPFVLDSTMSTYPFTIRVEGTYQLKGDALLVSVRGGEIRSAIPADLGEDGVATEVRIAFGLGGSVENGWRMQSDTADQVLAARLVPGESVSFQQLAFVVSGVGESRLNDQWLAVRLGVVQHHPGVPAGLLWSYACSEDNVLGPTAASRERAKLMKSAYSHTC